MSPTAPHIILAVAALLITVVFCLTFWSIGRPRDTRRVSLPVVAPRPIPRCRTCAHFNLQAGQDVILRQPVFKEVTSVLTVAEVGYGYTHDDEGVRTGVAAPKEALGFRWEDIGACVEHQELRVGTDVCDQYVPRAAD